MNISVTIPQLFYDVIARVVPGFLFLLILRIELWIAGVRTDILGSNDGNFVESLGAGIGYAILCYVTGIVLRAFVVGSHRQTVEARHARQGEDLRDVYRKIQVSNGEAGFRLTKLRAEAVMLEVSRTGMMILAAVATVILVAYLVLLARATSAVRQDWLALGILLAPFLLMIGFRRLEERAWNLYYGSLRTVYALICGDSPSSASDAP